MAMQGTPCCPSCQTPFTKATQKLLRRWDAKVERACPLCGPLCEGCHSQIEGGILCATCDSMLGGSRLGYRIGELWRAGIGGEWAWAWDRQQPYHDVEDHTLVYQPAPGVPIMGWHMHLPEMEALGAVCSACYDYQRQEARATFVRTLWAHVLVSEEAPQVLELKIQTTARETAHHVALMLFEPFWKKRGGGPMTEAILRDLREGTLEIFGSVLGSVVEKEESLDAYRDYFKSVFMAAFLDHVVTHVKVMWDQRLLEQRSSS